MDIGDTIAPKSEQLDAVDLASGPMTFTITSVVIKQGDQPATIHLAEFPRPWRPNLNTRRVLSAAWGPSKNDAYVGRRVTLFCDPNVDFGGIKTGGVRITHMSDLPGGKPFSTPVLVKKGRAEMYTVQPLADRPAPSSSPTEPSADVEMITDRDTLRAMWRGADSQTRAQIEARIAALDAEADLTNGPRP